MFFRQYFKTKAWVTLLLSASFSASLLSLSNSSDGQQPDPQQALQSALQQQNQDLQSLLSQHETQRQAITNQIQTVASTSPVNQQAIQRLQKELEDLQKRQDREKQALANDQRNAQDVLRRAVNPQNNNQPETPETPETEVTPVTEAEPIVYTAILSQLPGVELVDANGTPVSGQVTIEMANRPNDSETYNVEIGIGGLASAAEVTAIQFQNCATGEVLATLDPAWLVTTPVGNLPSELVPNAEPLPESILIRFSVWASVFFREALRADNLCVVIKTDGHPTGALKGQLSLGVTSQIAGLALDRNTIPEPLVVDRSFTKLGTVNDVLFEDEAAAIQLGKALFWDVQVGSDNKTACATCHNFGGADWRTKNQLAAGGNHQLTPADFKEPHGRLSVNSGKDIVGSQGVMQDGFMSVNPGSVDACVNPTPAELFAKFTLDGTVSGRTRQTTGRNAPNVINAAFYARQFWDGRAHRFFNGENIFGTQDPDAGVWENNGGTVEKNTNFLVDFSSLASQAMGPPGSSTEMAHGPSGARSFLEIGRKLLDVNTQPLGLQNVHPDDSVLATMVNESGMGLSSSYADLVKAAFKAKYWNATGIVTLAVTPDGVTRDYTHMEANFALFFGMAVQAYERTLISDQSPFDKFARGEDAALTADQKEGMNRFMSGGTSCTACHGGAMFSAATWASIAMPVEPMSLPNAGPAIYDNGFYNIGVQDQTLDAGVGRTDLPFGLISLAKLAAGDANPNGLVSAQNQWPNLRMDFNLPARVEGMFKTPTLRNVELSAPFFHTGNYSTLEDVVAFYSRGSDFPLNPDLDDDIHPIGQLEGKPDKIAQVAAFLRSLTDDRVRFRSAPFDGPELVIPNGHKVVGGFVVDDNVTLPATGQSGVQTAFASFTDRLHGTTPAEPAEPAEPAPSVNPGDLAGQTADAMARTKDAQMSALNQLVNESQAAFNAETQVVNNQLNTGSLTPQQQNAALIDIDQRRNARMLELSNMMNLVDAGLDPGLPVTPPVVTPPVEPVIPPVEPVEPVVPVESLIGAVTGNAIVEDRRPSRDRLDVMITDVPLAVLSNENGLIMDSVITEDFAVLLKGLSAEFLDANGDVVMVSTDFEAEFQASNLLVLAMSIRDPATLATLTGVTQVRISQTEPGLAVRVLATVALPDGTAAVEVP